jgi:hypothetical protein
MSEKTEIDLKLLQFYSLLSSLLEMDTGVALPMDQEDLEKKVKEAYERLVSSPKGTLPRDVREEAEKDFRRVAKLSKRIAETSPETRAKLLRNLRYKEEYEHIHDKIREYLNNRSIQNIYFSVEDISKP